MDDQGNGGKVERERETIEVQQLVKVLVYNAKVQMLSSQLMSTCCPPG